MCSSECVRAICLFLFLLSLCQADRPHVILLLADDLGYGDLSSSGHPSSRTPNIDKLMQSSLSLSSFYSASPVCSPSRAALLTGLYPVSTGIYPGVFTPGDLGGLQTKYPTIASQLKERNYLTYHIGKWHLGVGVDGQYLPVHHGFDHYLGVPYSHDMCPCRTCYPGGMPCHDKCRPDTVSCPLYRDSKIIAQPVDLTTLNNLYTREAVKFMQTSVKKEKNFFLYLAFHHPHHPQFSGEKFYNQSARGMFGDSLLELDWSVGTILDTLDRLQIRDNTVLVFTSDNGPSIARHQRGGCAGLLRCGKGTTYEGGVRVPALISYPNIIPPGVMTTMVSMLDVLPNILKLVDGSAQEIESSNNCLLFYPDSPHPDKGPYAIRCGQYKAHVYTRGSSLSDDENPDSACHSSSRETHHSPPLLFNLDTDPGERWDISQDLPEVARKLEKELQVMAASTPWAPSQMERGNSPSAAPCCNKYPCQPWPGCCDCNN